MGIDHLLIHRADIQKPKTVPLGAGKFREDYPTIHASAPVRIHAASGGDIRVADKEKARCTHACYARADEDLHVGYRVVRNGITYGVTVRLVPSVDTHHLKVLLAEIQVTPSSVAVTGDAEVVE
jgi:hypothetical protein